MSLGKTLLAGPDPRSLRAEARMRADNVAGDHTEAVLYLTQSRTTVADLRREWAKDYNQLRLTCSTLDEYVGELFEEATGTLATAQLTRPERFRLVEAAIEQHAPVDDTVFSDITGPSTALIDQVQGLFSLLEYAGYDSPDRVERALQVAGATENNTLQASSLYGAFRNADLPDTESTLAEQARVFSDIQDRYRSVHEEVHPDWIHTVAEQYLHLLDADQLVESVPDSVDVIILDGLTRLAPAERAAVARLADAYPTVAVVPLAHQATTGEGTDAGIARALDFYTGVGFSPEYHTETPAPSARVDAVQELYTQGQLPTRVAGTDADLTVLEPPTERTEVRAVARRVQSLLVDGADPADIGVIVTDRARYRSILAETLPTYDIPFTFTNEIGIEQTLVGDAVEAILELSDTDQAGTAVRRLATNSLVDLTSLDIDPEMVTTAANQTTAETAGELISQLEEIDATSTTAVQTVVDRLTPATQSLSDFVATVQAVIDELGLQTAVTAYGQGPTPTNSHRPAYEQSAIRAITRVLESFEDTSQFLTDTEPAARLKRAVRAELVSGPRQQPEYVRVQPIAEAEMAAFEHVFIIGLTMQSFPAEGDTMAFFDGINDAAEEFSREDTGRRAEYIFGTLLTGSRHVTLSHPQHTIDGGDHVPAPIMTELAQYVDTTVERDLATAPRVTSEDVQDSYARWATPRQFESPRPAVAPLKSATGISTTATMFGSNGAKCSWHRSRGGLSPYDAQVPDRVDEIYPPDDREPYSPTALEDYARCPFVFLMDRVLGFENEYDDDAEITRGDRGTYIHETLATFYRSLRDEFGPPVDVTAHDRSELEARLLQAAQTEREAVEEATTPFSERVLGRLLSGLGTPADNEYYSYRDGADGLFVRLLETELDLHERIDTHPRYFEGAIGLHWLDTDHISETPEPVSIAGNAVTIRGIVDRVDETTDSPLGLHIRDYKTGSIPSTADVTLGTKLQLPVYGYVAEAALTRSEDTPYETIAGSYYDLGSPDSIDPTSTLVTAEDVINDVATGGQAPFETRADLRRFITDVTPTRVNQITTGIANGGFHPTLLSAEQAGCADCTFRRVCDVRHHHQRETIATVDQTEHYVSERAAGTELDLSQYPTGGQD